MEERKTVIAEGTLVRGQIEGSGDVELLGRLEGDVRLGGSLLVQRTGVASANVEAQHVLVAGTLVGNVSATDLIEVTSEGRVVGDVAAPRVVVAEGAAVRGRIDMSGGTDGDTARATEARSARRPTASPAAPAVVTGRRAASATQGTERADDWPFTSRPARSEATDSRRRRATERSEGGSARTGLSEERAAASERRDEAPARAGRADDSAE